MNDVIAYDVSTLLGPKADHFAFEECLESVGLYGRAEHIVVSDASVVFLCVHCISVGNFFVANSKLTCMMPLLFKSTFTLIFTDVSCTPIFISCQTTIYRRDGKPMSLSVHMFPVFDSSRDAFYPDTGSCHMTQ